MERTPLVAFFRWLQRATRDGGEVGGGGGGVFAAAARAARSVARAMFAAVMGAVLRRLLGGRREFECPLVTVSDVIDRHGVTGVGLLKVDVERAELAVLRGVSPAHWPIVRQVAMEVHDSAGGTQELQAVRELLVGVGGFEAARVVAEQPRGLQGTTLWNLYATRAATDKIN